VRYPAGALGAAILFFMLAACLGTLPWTLSPEPPAAAGAIAGGAPARFNAGSPRLGRLPPSWWPPEEESRRRMNALVPGLEIDEIAERHHVSPEAALAATSGPVAEALLAASPYSDHPVRYFLGTDTLGRSLLYRCLTGGGISLLVGLAAAALSVIIGTTYGAVSGYIGGRTDAVMMRIVDVLYGLPYVLLVVLVAVAGDAMVEEFTARSSTRQAWVQGEAIERLRAEGHGSPTRADAEALLRSDADLRSDLENQAAAKFPARHLSEPVRTALDLTTLLVAIGGVSWLTMARIIRGQVQSLKGQPFVESARAIGVGPVRLFARHLLPNLSGPIIVYATLTVPQAILQESFLSFLGIGVKPPLPSWGNLAADGLSELNPYQSNWWLLLFPCVLLAVTLLALNFVGEALRETLDPRRTSR